MLPTLAVRLQLGNLLAADTTTLAPAASANKIALIKEPFNYDENQTASSLTFADFTGATPIAGETGSQATGIDPTTLDQIITILDPVGGYRWITGDAVNLPQTIYGAALTDNAGTTLLALLQLNPPILLQEAGQQIDLGTVTMTLNPQPIS